MESRKNNSLIEEPGEKVSLLILLKTVIFYIVFVVSVPPTAVIMWMAHLISSNIAFNICKIWGRLVNLLLKWINNIEIECKGSPLNPKEPTLIIANHTGPWETVALMPFMPINYTYVLKKQLLSWKYNFFALGLRAIEPIGIKRESNAGDFSIMKDESQKRFKNGIHVLLFPGGTRKHLKESIHFGPGGILLAKKLKCNIQPVFIDSESWARGKYIKDYGLIYPGIIRVNFGTLITKEEVSEKKAKELQSQMESFLRSNL